MMEGRLMSLTERLKRENEPKSSRLAGKLLMMMMMMMMMMNE